MNRFTIALLVAGAAACGVSAVVVAPPAPPVGKASQAKVAKLAYEESITTTGSIATPAEPSAAEAAPEPALPAADATPAETGWEPTAEAPAEPPVETETAGIEPPSEAAIPEEPNADPLAQDGTQDGALPDGSDQQQLTDETAPPQEEWVAIAGSGVAMRASAADDAPMLFAFPYGRKLRVVSRYSEWVEVTDPQSAATGWIRADYLTPVYDNGPQQFEQAYEEPRQRGWWRRNRGGMADMINRALGGGF